MSSASAAEQVSAALPALYALTTEEEFPTRALTLVGDVVGGDKCDYTDVDLVSGEFRVLVDPLPPQLDALAPARRAYMRQHPVLGHFLHDPGPGARAISDFLTRREYRRLAVYGEFFVHLGVEHQMTTLITRPASRRRVGISVDRDGPAGFSEDDRRLMDALQPHLVAARENAVRFSRALASPATETEAPAGSLDRLTERQREILELISQGRTNAQIAYALGISAGTVRKHVEHILKGLEVQTRTAAAVWFLRCARDHEPTPWTATVGAMITPSQSRR